MRGHTKNLSKYGAGLFYNAIGAGFAVLTQIILARLMGPSEFGVLTLTLSLVLLPTSVADFGITASLPRFISVSIGENRPGKVRAILLKAGLFMAVNALIFTCLMYAVAPIIARWMDIEKLSPTISVLAAFIPTIYLKNYCSAILKGTGSNVKEIFLSQVVFLSMTFGLGVLFWLITRSTVMVVTGHGIGYLVTSFIFIIFAWRKASIYKSSQSEHFALMDLLSHGLPLNITALAQRIFQRADVIVIGSMLNEQAVGLYKVAFAAASGIKHLITPLNNFAGYWLGIYAGSRQTDNLRRYYMGLVLSSLVLTLPPYFLMFTLAGDIIPVIFGDEYKTSILLTQILCLGFVFFTAVGPMGTLFNTVGRNWIRMWLVTGMSMFNIVANVILIRFIGILGTAISTCFSFIIIFFVFQCIVKRIFIGFSIPPHPFVLLICSTGVGVLSLFLPTSLLKYRIITGIAGTLVVGFLSYITTWHYLHSFEKNNNLIIPEEIVK